MTEAGPEKEETSSLSPKPEDISPAPEPTEPEHVESTWGAPDPGQGSTDGSDDPDDPYANLPSPPEGKAWRAFPFNDNFISDPEWFDGLGRDKLVQKGIWKMTDLEKQTAAVLKLLDEFPKRGLCMLFESAVRGYVHLVRALLRAGVPPHCGSLAQHSVSDEGENDASSSKTDDGSLVPIHAAAYRGHVECVKALVEEGGVDPDIPDGTGTPLMRAHMAPHIDVIRYLLSTGRVDLRRRRVFDGRERHPLEWVLRNGNAQSAKMLAEALWQQGEPRVVPPEALEAAADSGVVGNLQFGLDVAGFPDLDAIASGDAALSAEQRHALVRAAGSAAQAIKLDALKLLIGYSDNPDGPFALQAEAKEAFRVALVRSAAEKSPEAFDFIFKILSRSDSYGQEERTQDMADGLFAATYGNCLPMVMHLVEKYQADPNTTHHPQKLLPLCVAAGSGNSAITQYLLRDATVKADIHLGSGEHGLLTALWYALRSRHGEVVRMLLRHGGPVDGVHPSLDLDFEHAERGSTDLRVVSSMNERREVRIYTTEDAFKSADRTEARSIVILKLDASDEDWWRKLQYRDQGKVGVTWLALPEH